MDKDSDIDRASRAKHGSPFLNTDQAAALTCRAPFQRQTAGRCSPPEPEQPMLLAQRSRPLAPPPPARSRRAGRWMACRARSASRGRLARSKDTAGSSWPFPNRVRWEILRSPFSPSRKSPRMQC